MISIVGVHCAWSAVAPRHRRQRQYERRGADWQHWRGIFRQWSLAIRREAESHARIVAQNVDPIQRHSHAFPRRDKCHHEATEERQLKASQKDRCVFRPVPWQCQVYEVSSPKSVRVAPLPLRGQVKFAISTVLVYSFFFAISWWSTRSCRVIKPRLEAWNSSWKIMFFFT